MKKTQAWIPSLLFFLYVVLNILSCKKKDAQAAAGCGGCLACGTLPIIIITAWIALVIFLWVWVAKDAKSRGMENAVVWMIIVIFTGLIGLVVYLLSRPKGDLVLCPHCNNKKLPILKKCPHCGNE